MQGEDLVFEKCRGMGKVRLWIFFFTIFSHGYDGNSVMGEHGDGTGSDGYVLHSFSSRTLMKIPTTPLSLPGGLAWGQYWTLGDFIHTSGNG